MQNLSIPRTDNALLTWANNFSQAMLSGYELYGISQQQADDFAAAMLAYRSALNAAQDPQTRTRGSVSAKNDARAALRTQASVLNKIIQANPNVSDAQKLGLGLAVARPRTRIGRPETAPSLEVVSVSSHTIDLRVYQLVGENLSAARGRPHGTVGALIMGIVSDQPEPDVCKYQLMGIASRSALKINFPATLTPGTKVYLCAMWLNNRKETSPASNPIYTYLQGGGVQMSSSLRMAA